MHNHTIGDNNFETDEVSLLLFSTFVVIHMILFHIQYAWKLGWRDVIMTYLIVFAHEKKNFGQGYNFNRMS